jgi:hypothetical protein
VVLSLHPAPPGHRRATRLAPSTQTAAHQSVLTGQPNNHGDRRGAGQQPQCEVELTEVHTSGQHRWTLGFEATGPADLLRSELQATAALVFAHALPRWRETPPR